MPSYVIKRIVIFFFLNNTKKYINETKQDKQIHNSNVVAVIKTKRHINRTLNRIRKISDKNKNNL